MTVQEIIERLAVLHAKKKNLAAWGEGNMRLATQAQMHFYYAAHDHFPALVREIERLRDVVEAAEKAAKELDELTKPPWVHPLTALVAEVRDTLRAALARLTDAQDDKLAGVPVADLHKPVGE